MKPGPLTVNVLTDSEGFEGQGVHTAFLEMTEALRARQDVRVLVNSDEPCDLIHAHTLGPQYLKRMWRYKGKRVVSAHVVPDSFKDSLILYPLWAPIARAVLRWGYNSADKVLCVSPAVVRELERLGVRAPLVFVPNCVNSRRFHQDPGLREQGRRKLGLADGQTAVISVGQVQPRKGVALFIELARSLPELSFFWAGGRPFGRLTSGFNALNAAIAAAPPNLSFLGTMPYDSMPALYNACDIFVSASTHETFGLVTAEAAACGLPLVMMDNPEYPELFGDAYLRATDHASFLKAVHEVLPGAPGRQPLLDAGAGLAMRYSSAAYAQRLVENYRSLLGA